MPPASLRHRSGCQLARLNRGVKARNRREVRDAWLFLAALALTVTAWVWACAL
jgi:hypothetical protein